MISEVSKISNSKGDGMRRAMIDIKIGDALENFFFKKFEKNRKCD
jgi:hypothetical protein